MKFPGEKTWHFEWIASSSVFLKGTIWDEIDPIFRNKASVRTFQRISLSWTKHSDHTGVHSEICNLLYNLICQEI